MRMGQDCFYFCEGKFIASREVEVIKNIASNGFGYHVILRNVYWSREQRFYYYKSYVTWNKMFNSKFNTKGYADNMTAIPEIFTM